MPTRIVINGREMKNPILRALLPLAGLIAGLGFLVVLLPVIGLVVAAGFGLGALLLAGVPALLRGRRFRPAPPPPAATSWHIDPPAPPAGAGRVIDVEAREIEDD